MGNDAHKRLFETASKTNNSRYRLIALIAVMGLLISSCDLFQTTKENQNPLDIAPPEASSTPPAPSPLIQPPLAEINFRVSVPQNTPPGEEVYLSILDEVTGLSLNAENNVMKLDKGSGSDQPATYQLTLPFPLGSVVKYRYERQSESIRVSEHTPDGNPVRYRIYSVQAPGTVDDIVSRWTDTPYTTSLGRIIGRAVDSVSGKGIPGLLVTTGGYQTFTASDGSFEVEGLPPGTHNLVSYAINGDYQTFQQGALVAADATTPTPINLSPLPRVNVNFVVTAPDNTPPIVPLRLAGNLNQLGNTFATLTGGVSSLASRMPVLTQLSDGRYRLSISLPVGAYIEYKYTLGDGFWNAEHSAEGEFKLRHFIVPAQDVEIVDQINNWYAGKPSVISFDVSVPENTPPQDFVSIQFNPLFGWTEAIPMWKLGENHWAYILYSPLNLPGNFSYRYCRNGQCGQADDAATPGQYGAGRPVKLDELPQTMKDQVEAWVELEPYPPPEADTSNILPRDTSYLTGIEMQPAYHPSWDELQSVLLDEAQSLSSNWLFFSPTWTYTRINPLALEPVAGKDILWQDMLSNIQLSRERNISVALFPMPNYQDISPCAASDCPKPEDTWWANSPHDYIWWESWFEHVTTFLNHHADLAEVTGAKALVIGGEWLSPALPGGVLPDGSPSGVPDDAETRWRDIISQVRSRFFGQLYWGAGFHGEESLSLPSFIDSVDSLYLLWSVPFSQVPDQMPGFQPSLADWQARIADLLDSVVFPVIENSGKPIILGFTSRSTPDLQTQLDEYSAMLGAVNQRDWISGFISRGYFSPAALQDESASVHGKPTSDLLQIWYPALRGIQ